MKGGVRRLGAPASQPFGKYSQQSGGMAHFCPRTGCPCAISVSAAAKLAAR